VKKKTHSTTRKIAVKTQSR